MLFFIAFRDFGKSFSKEVLKKDLIEERDERNQIVAYRSGAAAFKIVLNTSIIFEILLIVLYPIIKKENQYFAWFSLVMGIIVLMLLLWFTFGNEVIRYQILKYGLQ